LSTTQIQTSNILAALGSLMKEVGIQLGQQAGHTEAHYMAQMSVRVSHSISQVGRSSSLYIANSRIGFIGMSVRVIGSHYSDRLQSTFWDCTVDGARITRDSDAIASPSNNRLFCYTQTPLDPGESHSLTVNATVRSNQTFWFDRIEYIPSKQVSLEQKAIRVEVNDPKVQVSIAMSTSPDNDSYTLRKVTFPFYGK
jgi:hypothetical protein